MSVRMFNKLAQTNTKTYLRHYVLERENYVGVGWREAPNNNDT
jgi:hypothetical protein